MNNTSFAEFFGYFDFTCAETICFFVDFEQHNHIAECIVFGDTFAFFVDIGVLNKETFISVDIAKCFTM